MSIEEISSSDPALRDVTAQSPARREGKDVVPSIKHMDNGVSKSTALITRDILDALAKDIQQFKGISFSDPAPGKVSALAWAWREGKNVVPSIKHGFEYMMSSKSYVQDLRKEVQNLADETERVNNAVEEAKNNAQNVDSHVTDWQASAKKALKEAQDLLGYFEEVNKTCCYGTLPSPNFRSQFCRKAKDKIEDIQKLALEGGKFKELYDIFNVPALGNVAAPNPARREGKEVVRSTTATASVFSASTSIKLRNDGVFESRALMIREIMHALADMSNSVVGVYGMGGIGKSTLLVDVERIIREGKMFDWVAKVDVSENPDIKTIQGEIADALGLTEIKDKETISGRAKLLHDKLKDKERKKMKVLIILDNLWEGLDLKKVGIPCRHDNKVMGCNLLLTSRHRDVLRRDMGCDKDFSLGGLKHEEAKRLFEKIVGDKVHDDELNSWVDVALDKCAGVPFLIVVMAKRFQNAELYEWGNTLKIFEEFKGKETSDLVNHLLRWSYDKLEEDVKSLLRLCVVYSISKPSLENLVRYGFGLGLFGEVSSMEEARNRLISHIHTLQASSCLLDCEDVDSFQIHDLIREVVASVASRDHPILVLKNKDKSITELPKDKLKSCRAVCFPYVDMKELPQELDCPELQIFLLFTKNESLKISYSLFHSMRKLMVLNLTGIHLTCSPSSSFQLLENLHTLCLDGCSLDNVAILGDLKGLKILSFANSNIHQLPKEIGQLAELRLLDLNDCSQLQIIEPGVLGSLIKLEELFMENSFDQWNAVEQAPQINASLIELNKMKNLYTLDVCIPDLTMLPEDLNIKKLTTYGIRIGGRCRPSHKGLRTLELKLNPRRDILRKGCIRIALDRIDDLYLDELNEIDQSICELFPEGSPNLKHLHIENSHSIHYIFRQVAFPNLETLDITGTGDIEMIWDNQIYFIHLKTLDISHCDWLTYMFTPTMVGNLVELTKLRISNCKILTQVISNEGAKEGHAVAFNRLMFMELDGLTWLRCFSSGGYSLIFPLLEDVTVTRCFNMKFFSEGPIEVPRLNKVQVSIATYFWKENLNITIQNMYEEMAMIAGAQFMRLSKFPELIEKWHSKNIPIEPFSKLESLVVDKCPLINAIPSTLILALHDLRILQVHDCESLEEIFDLKGLEGVESTQMLTQLWHLSLVNLPKLRQLGNKSLQGRLFFNSLSHLTLYKCNNLRHAFATSMIQHFATLKYMEIKECDQMERVIAEEEGHESAAEKIIFSHLWWMELKYLPNLTSFFLGKNHMLECPNLKWLTISHCPIMRSFTRQSFMEIDHDTPSLFTSQVAFPSLETLYITALDNIEMIWDNQVVADSFHHLKHLHVQNCDKLANLVPSCIRGCLLSLESFEARACGLLEVVFKLQPLNPLDGHPIDCFPLKKLELFGLPKLKCVWDKELRYQVRFQCLCVVSVSKCESLTSLFPVSIARDLLQLEELKIDECGIVELIDKEGQVPKDVFPKLTSLKFKHLTELKCIYIGTHALHLPALKTLEVHGCNQVEILASQPENEMPLHKRPLFLIEKGTFPNLQELKLDLSERMEIFHGHFDNEEFFCKLRFLELFHLSKESAISTFRFVQSLTTLEDLVVCESNLEGLPINVEAIEGSSHGLKVILPLSRYLKALHVSHCDGLSYLFTPTIVRNLMELTKLRISNCKMLTEVIIDEVVKKGPIVAFSQSKYVEHDALTELRCFMQNDGEGSAVETIRFPNLRWIELECLPDLTSFLSEKNQRLECPVLEEVTITHCPKMTRIGMLIPRCPPFISRALNGFTAPK